MTNSDIMDGEYETGSTNKKQSSSFYIFLRRLLYLKKTLIMYTRYYRQKKTSAFFIKYIESDLKQESCVIKPLRNRYSKLLSSFHVS